MADFEISAKLIQLCGVTIRDISSSLRIKKYLPTPLDIKGGLR